MHNLKSKHVFPIDIETKVSKMYVIKRVWLIALWDQRTHKIKWIGGEKALRKSRIVHNLKVSGNITL